MGGKILSAPYLIGISLLLADPLPLAVIRMQSLVDRLEAAQSQQARGKAPRVTFQFSESEINEYLRYSLKEQPRPGIESIRLKFFPRNYVSSFTLIDLDEIERWRPGTIPTLMRPILRGRKTLWVDLRFNASGGATTFQVEKAYFDKVRMPALMVEKLIETIAERQPEKYDTTKPLPLPLGIQRLWTDHQTVAGEN